mmetsp:Transcript_160346/g.292784  ORF Transcript_160346/g.292784 Transcript_160346/m.292784 type:complete len:355 (-) Transcript_160346:116-1180(-)
MFGQQWLVMSWCLSCLLSYAQSLSCTEDEESMEHPISLLQHGMQFRAPVLVPEASIPPFVYIRTHKTGSSTLNSVLMRMIDRHDARFKRLMLGLPGLGWPGHFPGSSKFGPPQHQYDAIIGHTVLNFPLMCDFMKPNPFFMTTLRHPLDQFISSKNFYFPDLTWDEFLSMTESDDRWLLAKMKNPQAFDLGWYEFAGESTKFDDDQAKINEWLVTLDNQLNHTILLEHFDEGLVLLSHKWQVEIEEMKYVVKNSNDEKILPSEGQRQRISALINVDMALYAHVHNGFQQQWLSGNFSKFESDLLKLQRVNSQLQDACRRNITEVCAHKFLWEDKDWNSLFNASTNLQADFAYHS